MDVTNTNKALPPHEVTRAGDFSPAIASVRIADRCLRAIHKYGANVVTLRQEIKLSSYYLSTK